MLFKMVTSEGIAHHSFIIGSQGKAAVIDPRRDCEIYLEIAETEEMAITHIFETHRNEDYCIGSRELAMQSGAEIFHGANLPFEYGSPVHDGDQYILGSLGFSVLETPGHTEESISIVLTDREVSDKPYMVFCGDVLFAGDIGRTDFYGRDRNAEMAGKIFDSIKRKILPLGDEIIVCPAHGAGSACGDGIRDYPFTTIGYERRTNPQLQKTRTEFIRERVNTSHYIPPYFRHMEEVNLKGTSFLAGINRPLRLSIPKVQKLLKSDVQILDIRSPTSFASGHIPGSLSIWRNGISSFTGWFFDYNRPILLVDDFNTALDPVILQLRRIGYDNLAGVLAGGFSSWFRSAQETAAFATTTVQELHAQIEKGKKPFILDVRDIANVRSAGMIAGAHHIWVGDLRDQLNEIPRDRPVLVTCDAGFKASLAASYLARNGYTKITNLLGGMRAWIIAGFPVEKTAVAPKKRDIKK